MADQPSRATLRWLFFGLGGRISREPFIYGQLFMVAVAATLLAAFLAAGEDDLAKGVFALAVLAFAAGSVWPTIALTVKRLHDLGQPGALALILFVPTVNFFFVVALMALPSKPEANQYGPPTLPPPDLPA